LMNRGRKVRELSYEDGWAARRGFWTREARTKRCVAADISLLERTR
jgi:hypothetical protein